jgi:hypothetical protein
MKTEREQLTSRNSQAESNETLVCEICGKFDAVRIGDRTLCLDCYHGCGSCCPEFGRDDLRSFPEDK